LLHNKLKAIQYKKACFSLPILTMHSEDLMIKSYEPVKIPDIGAFFKITVFPDNAGEPVFFKLILVC